MILPIHRALFLGLGLLLAAFQKAGNAHTVDQPATDDETKLQYEERLRKWGTDVKFLIHCYPKHLKVHSACICEESRNYESMPY